MRIGERRKRHFRCTVDDNGEGKARLISVTIDDGYFVMRQYRGRKRFSISVREAMGLIFRKAQVSECQRLFQRPIRKNSATE